MATISIAIVEAAGEMGSAIARTLQGKCTLLLASRDEAKIVGLKSELGASTPDAEVYTLNCAREAAWEADIIIVATPYEMAAEVADKIREVAVGKIVISISTPDHRSVAEELQKLLPYSKVVNAFNTAFGEHSKTATKEGEAADVFIAGNDNDAVETVSRIVASAGLSPVAVGGLSKGKTLDRRAAVDLDQVRSYQRSMPE